MDTKALKAKQVIELINDIPNLKAIFKRNHKSKTAFENHSLTSFELGDYDCNEFLSFLSIDSLVNIYDFLHTVDESWTNLTANDFSHITVQKKPSRIFTLSLKDRIKQSLNSFNLFLALESSDDKYMVLLKPDTLSTKAIGNVFIFYYLRASDLEVHVSRIQSVVKVKDVLNTLGYKYAGKNNQTNTFKILDASETIVEVTDNQLTDIFYDGLNVLLHRETVSYVINGREFNNNGFKNLINSVRLTFTKTNKINFSHLTFEQNYQGLTLNNSFIIFNVVTAASTSWIQSAVEEQTYSFVEPSFRYSEPKVKSKLDKDKSYKLRDIVKDNQYCRYVIADESFLDIITEGKKYQVIKGCRIILQNKVSFNPEKLKFKICE